MEPSIDGEPVLPTTETDDAAAPKITDTQWRAVKSVLEALLSYRDEEGHDPTKIFHKRVNRRNVPDYYEVIKEPMAFSNLKQKTVDREYVTFAEFVRDNALIWHNAHTYNRPDAGAYQDASVLKELMEDEFEKLVEQKIITDKDAQWPDLGEIPPVEDIPEEEEEDVDEEDEDEDDEPEDSEEEMPKRRRPGRPARRDTMQSDKGDKNQKRRGRPPKVDTPMEGRIKNILKGIRKVKNEDGVLIGPFEKLPEKTSMPEYYVTIKKPMSLDQIKKSLKRKRYGSVDDFMRDMDTMFENAKLYNEDDSEIHQYAVELQGEAHKLAELEKKRPDTEFVMEEGRKPRPEGITHKGNLWKVGDWVHITNANDPAKPIVAQIYRTYEDSDGQEWVNACWYYRPEQTVHQFEKHFYPMEVVKTGQYRDHPIDDVIDRCYVMFFTRFPKGRPRGLAPDAKVYVCEARYNEEKHKINKIKTWASCLPDEIRDQDYEMDLFHDGPRRNKKVPSPLSYMLDQGGVGEEAPEPKWGEENAPPIIGGIYKGTRDENQTPPPPPTPTPPPQPRPSSHQAAAPREDPWGKADEHFKKVGETFGDLPRRSSDAPQQAASTPQRPPTQQHHGASASQYTPGPGYPAHAPSYTPQTQPPNMATQNTYSFEAYAGVPQRPTTTATAHSQVHAQATPQARYGGVPAPPSGRQADAFILNEHQNQQIPAEVRAQFHRDAHGHVLFFTKPPLATLPPARAARLGGHTVAYRAARLKRQLLAKMQADADADAAIAKPAPRAMKRQRTDVVMTNGTSVPDDARHAPEHGSAAHPSPDQSPATPPPADAALPDSPAFAALTGMSFAAWYAAHRAGTRHVLAACRPYAVSDAELDQLELRNLQHTEAAVRAGAGERAALEASWAGRERDRERDREEMWRERRGYGDDVDGGLGLGLGVGGVMGMGMGMGKY